MAYNILSGNVSETDLILSGAFSGAYVGDFDGDGYDLVNVTYISAYDGGQHRIPYFGTANSNGDWAVTGSRFFTYDNGTKTLTVSGTINANEFNIDVINKNVINLDVSGSTKFGDTDDDTHQYTGSILLNGPLVMNRIAVTSSTYTMVAKNYFVAIQTTDINSSSTINLPSAATLREGQSFVIKDEQGSADNFNIQVATNGSDVIDGQSEILIESPYGAINLYTNGSDKFFIY